MVSLTKQRVSLTKQRGFTLVELLIVVSIISILAAVVSANYIDSIERADAAACQENLRAVYQALVAYKVDFAQFPLGDCMADSKPRMDATAWGCGPAANGYWCGVSLALSERGYCSEDALHCPALKRTHDASVEAYSSCGDSELSGKSVPQWKFLRFAYNSAASDSGGYGGGQSDIANGNGNEWLVRCLHLEVGLFDPDRAVRFPFRIGPVEDEPGWTWYGEFELTVGGSIQSRKVEKRRSR